MLKQRVITALVLLALFLPALFASIAWPFMVLTLLLMTAGAWEWGRLNGLSLRRSLVGAMVWGGICAVIWHAGWALHPHREIWWLAGTAWVLLGAWMIHRGVQAWGLWPVHLRWLGGLLLLALAWLAMVQARARGVNFLLSVLVLVWVADVFAYFTGRTLGGRWFSFKLAPTISPGKSWEGVLGGMAGVLLVAGLWSQADSRWHLAVPSLYSLLFAQGWVLGVSALLLLSAMSVVGDLVESLVKRSAGFKDSSGLLPGHGGVLDRVDALLPTLPLAMMLVSWL